MFGREKKAADLIAKAYDRLDQWDSDAAHKIALKLKKLGNTGYFEIAARAYWMEGEEDKAVDVLREGTRVAPQVFILWADLGQYLSDLGRYDEALAAYEQTRGLLGQTQEELDYNAALVLYRKGDYHAAWERLERVPLPYEGLLRWHVLELRGWLHLRLGRSKEAEDLVEMFMAEGPKLLEDVHLSRWLWLRAEAMEAQGIKAEALELLRQTVVLDKGNDLMAEQLRTLEDRRSTRAKLWRIQVNGAWPEEIDGKRCNFICSYLVVADDPDQALGFAKAFERDEVQPTMRINQTFNEGEPKDDLLGVVHAPSGYTFYVT